jgi:hemerythrin superfamily protein
MANAKGLVELLLRDHRKVKRRLGQLDSTFDENLGIYFCKLREGFVRHERAEELIVYPAFREKVRGGDVIANECITEHSRAEETLADLSEQDPQSPSFRAQLIVFRLALLAHAKHEEAHIFPALQRHTDRRELAGLGQLYEMVLEATPPTHPHPLVLGSVPGNMVLGSMAALIDRVQVAMYEALEGSLIPFPEKVGQ